MNSSTPYLIRAINEWILDNDCTPYMIVDATMDDVSVPLEYVKDGQIVLNISPRAIRDLVISDEFVMFSGRFSGRAHEIHAPITAVLGVIAKENGEGMWFPKGHLDVDPVVTKPGLAVASDGEVSQRSLLKDRSLVALSSDNASSDDSSSDEPPPKPPAPKGSSSKKGPPSLKVVK